MKVKVAEQAIWHQVLDDLLLLDPSTGRYFSLDATGAHMWEALTTSPDVEQAKQQLLATFDVDEAVLVHDLADLIARLVDAGLLQAQA